MFGFRPHIARKLFWRWSQRVVKECESGKENQRRCIPWETSEWARPDDGAARGKRNQVTDDKLALHLLVLLPMVWSTSLCELATSKLIPNNHRQSLIKH